MHVSHSDALRPDLPDLGPAPPEHDWGDEAAEVVAAEEEENVAGMAAVEVVVAVMEVAKICAVRQ